MKRMMLWCAMSMAMAACGPQELQGENAGADEASLGALPPVVNCPAYTTEALCPAAACAWRPVPCPLAAQQGGGPTVCNPFACVSKDPGPTGCGTVSVDGTVTTVPCNGGVSTGGPRGGGVTQPGGPR